MLSDISYNNLKLKINMQVQWKAIINLNDHYCAK